ncbi:DUF4160 domain-containing protein [Candidatus Peregrinibacteria bacterium]|nr:DUF4160 domain-containing protein [Candidatus Peregrinibacteria bacterium]MBI3816502.1 DUF4160 domain-containing protein [Candidatus Peregrinibacteria bacterium]
MVQILWDYLVERVYNLQTPEILEGSLPQRAHALVLEWSAQHRSELLEDWELTRQGKEPRKIDPLP